MFKYPFLTSCMIKKNTIFGTTHARAVWGESLLQWLCVHKPSVCFVKSLFVVSELCKYRGVKYIIIFFFLILLVLAVGANHTAFTLPHFWVSDANWDAPCPSGVAWSLTSGVDPYQKKKPACLWLCSAGLMFHYERHLSFTSHIPATSWKSPEKRL